MEPILAVPRRDDTAADARALEQLGVIEPQPTPAPSPEAPPVESPAPPAPDPVDQQEAADLSAALVEAGVTATAEDQAAVQALAKLDAATVSAVTRWMQAKKTKPEVGK